MATIKVKLRDPNSIFRDSGQNITITGKNPVEVKRTQTIHEAIRGGALVIVQETAKKAATKPETKTEDKPKEETKTTEEQAKTTEKQDSKEGDSVKETKEETKTEENPKKTAGKSTPKK